MNWYELIGKITIYSIAYFISSAILGIIIVCGFFGSDWDELPKLAWIGGCIVCVIMVLHCG